MMKHFLLFFLFIAPLTYQAQNITITDDYIGTQVPANHIYTYWIPDSNFTFQYIDVRYFTVNVNYSTTSRILVRKYEIVKASPGVEIYFCTNTSCYPYWIMVSDTLDLDPNGSFNLSVDYKTAFTTGFSSASYTILNANNPSDSIQFTVNYNIVSGGVGIAELNNSNTLSAPMPNPASGQFALQYNTGSTTGALLNMYNAIGELVSSSTLNNTQGIHVTDTAALPEGIYICTLVSEGLITGTQRIVVVR
jgi:hypothetical protein